MEELKLLVEMVSHLPAMAIWVLFGYLVYKIVVIGSIYGLIRFAIEKLHSWKTSPKQYSMRSLMINESIADSVMVELRRLTKSSYFHASEVTALREAIDAYKKNRNE